MTLLDSNVGGSGSYARGLLEALKRRDDVEMRVIRAPRRGGVGTAGWLMFGARKVVRKERADLLHSPGFLTPIRSESQVVITVHDLSLAQMPEGQALEWQLYYRWLFPTLVKRAAAVITPTEVTKHDVIQTFGVPSERITITPYGVDEQFFQAHVSATRRRNEPTILFAGPPIKRKNLDAVLRAFAFAADSSLLKQGRLLITGARAEEFPDYARTIEVVGLAGRVEWLGTVPYTDLPDLYASSDVFVYPSFLEGFGFPPLEAMASGTPVVASSASCLPEVLDGAAVLVDPNDASGLARALESVLADSNLRESLIHAGASRARGFTWERCAELTADAYRAALNGR